MAHVNPFSRSPVAEDSRTANINARGGITAESRSAAATPSNKDRIADP
jgi:hypothetical protein